MRSALAEAMPKPGETIGAGYVIEGVLGQGGVSVVYAARRGRERFAIKMLVPQVAAEPEVLHRLKREARAAMQLRGPHIARVYEVDATPEGLPFIVMERLEGRDLAAEIQHRKGVFSIEEAVGLVLQACDAVAIAHAAGIVHRDLKPANLFVCGEGERRTLKILDFGVSKLTDQGQSQVTATEVVLGTPVYMSPEQIDSARKVDARTDIWALGVILYELLACELPFRGTNVTAVLTSVMADAPKPLAPRRPDAPPPLVDAVIKALQKEPEARFQKVEELVAAIAPFGPKPTPSRGRLYVVGVAVVVVIAVIAVSLALR
jgi:serine/threonine-protein kinase